MKKVLGLFSSLLVFAGVKVKAQDTTAIKKETVKPVLLKPIAATDSLKSIKIGTTNKATDKAIKFDHIKKTAPVQMKESPAVSKPHKG
ncbi:hypothetical protein [Ferruginibacter sp. SUN106]|uniref:hypothetical protein n=1 Tax=Ferruginibacter sp. SUN106 TaxID=2978348 RepID=UPI003D35E182